MKDMKEQVARVRPLALYASLRIPEYYMVAEVRYDEFDAKACSRSVRESLSFIRRMAS